MNADSLGLEYGLTRRTIFRDLEAIQAAGVQLIYNAELKSYQSPLRYMQTQHLARMRPPQDQPIGLLPGGFRSNCDRFTSKPSFPVEVPKVADTPFSQWTERLKVYNDYIRALAEYKKSSAEADVLEAQRLGLLEEAKAKAIVVRQLARDMQGLVQVRNRTQNETERVERRQRDAEVILRGTRVDVVSLDRAWRAYRTFEAQALTEDADALFEIVVPSEAQTPDNFIDVRRGQQADAAPDKLVNAIMLAAWLQGKRYMAAAGSPAQRIVARLFSAIDGVAQATVDELQTYLREIEARTYDAWKPVSILGVPSGPADKKIQEAGARAVA